MNLKSIGKFLSSNKSISNQDKNSDSNKETNESKSKLDKRVTPESNINEDTKGLVKLDPEINNEVPNESENNKSEELPSRDSTKKLISYKNASDLNLNWENKDAVEEFIRHNKEIERLIEKDIDTDEKLGRDKFGQDILEDERNEKRRKDNEKKAKDEQANKLAAERSKGSLEKEDKKKDNEEFTESPLGDGMKSIIAWPLLNGVGWLGNNIAKGFNWLNKNGIQRVKRAAINGARKLGKLGLRSAKWLGRAGWNGTKWATKKTLGAAKKVTNYVGKIIKNQLNNSKTFNKIRKGVNSLSSGIKNIGSKVKKALSPAVNAIKKPLNKVAEVAKNKIINPATGLAKKVGKKILNSRAAKAVKFLANPKALGKLGKKMLSKILPAVPKLAAKLGMVMAKAGGKAALKQIPVLGIAMGIGEAISDITKGDYVGAGLAALSGIAPTLNLIAPGVGTAISMGAIGADIARDVLKDPIKDAVQVFDQSTPESILAEGDIDLSNSVRLPEEGQEGNFNSAQALMDDGNEQEGNFNSAQALMDDGNEQEGNFNSAQALMDDGNEQGVNFSSESNTELPEAPQNYVEFNQDNLSQPKSGNQRYIFPTKSTNKGRVGMRIGEDFKDRMHTAMNFFTDPNGLNLTPDQAAGIVGVLSAESKLIPHIVNKAERDGTALDRGIKYLPQGYGAGIAQWTNPNSRDKRKNQILDYINKTFGRRYNKIEDANLHEQLSAVKHDLEVNRPKTLAMLRNTRNINDATDIILRGYENGGNGILAPKSFIDKYTWAGGYSGSMYDPKNGRVNFANAALNEFKSRNSNSTEGFLARYQDQDLSQPVGISKIENSTESISAVGLPQDSSADKLATNISITKSDTDLNSELDSNKNTKSSKSESGNIAIREGDSIVGPTINEGDQKVINVTNITYTDLLTSELFG